ncbi:MAG TPA: hypothetical protein VFC78_07085 [Tepidisphaeraceae bacterium]|nr:hypothetical protein [Tepidisphaeraceae bacterium]
MDPREFTALAIRLTQRATAGTPAECRTAISRAYYAAFNVGAEHLRTMGFRVGKGAAAHGEVQRSLANSGNAGVVAAASELNDLHTSRNRADYQLDRLDVESSANARGFVAQAQVAIRALDAAFGGLERAQLQVSIQKWR